MEHFGLASDHRSVVILEKSWRSPGEVLETGFISRVGLWMLLIGKVYIF
jgi:hypothetical protein